jgi:hypothetical protein
MGKAGTNHHGSIPTMEHWRHIPEEYEKNWNFPNCVGSLDGKHINIQFPIKVSSVFYSYSSYKENDSIVMLALVDANYKFVIIDVGSYGRNSSDGNISARSSLGNSLQNETLILPADSPLTENGEPQPHVIDGDEAFPLKPYLLRP